VPRVRWVVERCREEGVGGGGGGMEAAGTSTSLLAKQVELRPPPETSIQKIRLFSFSPLSPPQSQRFTNFCMSHYIVGCAASTNTHTHTHASTRTRIQTHTHTHFVLHVFILGRSASPNRRSYIRATHVRPGSFVADRNPLNAGQIHFRLRVHGRLRAREVEPVVCGVVCGAM
jgi:hypothetical protein